MYSWDLIYIHRNTDHCGAAVRTVSISRSLFYVQSAFKFQYFRIASGYIYECIYTTRVRRDRFKTSNGNFTCAILTAKVVAIKKKLKTLIWYHDVMLEGTVVAARTDQWEKRWCRQGNILGSRNHEFRYVISVLFLTVLLHVFYENNART